MWIIYAISLALLSTVTVSLDNGVTLPPLGWSTWNALRSNYNESVIHEVADAMVSSAMVAAGYTHLNIDDAWSLRERDASSGSLIPNPEMWPSGMPALASYLTARGLSLGIYTSHCSLTCLGFPGALGHEEQDAQLYASWPVTLLKNDNCANRAGFPACDDTAAFTAMRDALNKTGQTIAYQVHWGNSIYPQRTIGNIANSWRVAVDMQPTWDSVLRLVDDAVQINALSKPGAFLDLDMLEVGNGDLTDVQGRSHFALWCMFASPLIAGNDPRHMSAATLATLLTKSLIAVDQDSLVIAARLVATDKGCTYGGNQNSSCAWQAFARPLADGSTALLILNRGLTQASVNVNVLFTLLDGVAPVNDAFDLWNDNAPLGVFSGNFNATVAPFDTVAVRLVAKQLS